MADANVNTMQGNSTHNGLYSVETKEYYEKNFMTELKDSLVLYDLCSKTSLPKNVGDTITWRLFKDLEVRRYTQAEATALGDATLVGKIKTLDEIPDFDGQKLKIIDFKAKLAQYGDYVSLTKNVDLFAIDPILSEISGMLGRQAGEVFDEKVMDGMLSGTNVVEAKNGITIALLMKIKASLKKRNVKPVNGSYIAIIDPETELDLKLLTDNNSSWIDIVKYAKPSEAYKGEIGTFMGFRWIVNNRVQTKTMGSGSDTWTSHRCIFMGEGAIGVVNLEGETNKPSIIVHGYGDAGEGAAKALNRLCTFGWVNNGFTTRILRDEAIIRVELGNSNEIIAYNTADSARPHYNSETGTAKS